MDTQNKEIVKQALTKNQLVEQLGHIGLKDNMIVEVHCSLKQVGFIVGGASSLVDALKEVLSNGTLVMPSQCAENTEPLNWCNPPIEMRLVDEVRNNMPGYDIYYSDIHHMGALALNLRSRKDTYHSYHPNCAFMATGKDGKYLMSNQPLNFPLGPNSPLEKMYNMPNSYILLIGCDYDNATAMHLGEYYSQVREIILQGGAVKRDGKTIWKKYLDCDIDSDEFVEIGKLMEQNNLVSLSKLGMATCKFVKIKDAVDFTTAYLSKKYGR